MNYWKKGPLILVFNSRINTPFKFDYFWQGTKSVDDFGIQYVEYSIKGVFNKWGILYLPFVVKISFANVKYMHNI